MGGTVLRNFTLALAGVLDGLLNLYSFVLLIAILLSWVNPDPYNPVVRFVRSATEPLLGRVRRWFPFVVIGGLDLSPLVVALALQFLRTFLVSTLSELAFRFAAAGTGAIG